MPPGTRAFESHLSKVQWRACLNSFFVQQRHPTIRRESPRIDRYLAQYDDQAASRICSDSWQDTLGNRSTRSMSGHNLGGRGALLRLTGGRRSRYSGGDFLLGECNRASIYIQVQMDIAGNRICPVCRHRDLVVFNQACEKPELATRCCRDSLDGKRRRQNHHT